jgi:hypothetical protein
MPVATTSGEQVVEAVVAGPDGANRLYTITGAATVGVNVSAGQTQTQTWTFLVGPTFTRGQFYRAIGTASVSSQSAILQTTSGNFVLAISSVEADLDDESGRVEVRVEVYLSSSTGGPQLSVNQLRYWVTVLAQV